MKEYSATNINVIYARKILNTLRILCCEKGPSWSGSYDRWIHNYISNQCLSPITLYSESRT